MAHTYKIDKESAGCDVLDVTRFAGPPTEDPSRLRIQLGDKVVIDRLQAHKLVSLLNWLLDKRGPQGQVPLRYHPCALCQDRGDNEYCTHGLLVEAVD